MTGGRWRKRVASSRPHVLDPHLRDVPFGEDDDRRAAAPCAPRPRRRGPGRRRPRSHRRGRARRPPARRPRARAAPSSTRSPAAACACGGAPPCPRGRTSCRLARSTVSIASRVVPGTSDTITRSRPTSAFRSDDLPTFGRPRMATRIASSPTGRSSRPGSRATISSRRSPVPWPCSAEIGIGSPSPRRWNSSASASRRGSSSLFASTSTGRRERAQDLRELLVAGRHSRLRVDDEEDEVRLLDRLRAPARRPAGRTAPCPRGRHRPCR